MSGPGVRTGTTSSLRSVDDRGLEVPGLAIADARDASLAQHVSEQGALFRFTDRLYRAQSPAETYEAALDAIIDALKCSRAALLLFDEGGVMRFVAWRDLSDTYRAAVDGHTPWRPGERDPAPICVSDIAAANEPEWLKDVIRREGIGALSFVPLTVHGATVGKFMTYYDRPHVYTPHEVELALTIARQLGFSLERAEAEAAMRHQRERLDALNHIARSLASDLDLERIVQAVTDNATRLSRARFGAFFYNVTDEQGERYTLYTLSGAPRSAFDNFGLPRNTAVFDPTFRGTGIIRADDIRKDPRYGHSAPHFGMPNGHLPVVSYLAVPVVSRSGKVHGGLFFGHDEAGIFTQEAEDIVTAIAAQAAVALDNAGLLQEAQREVERRRRAEERQHLLLREMDHRIKNLFAVVGSLVGLSTRSAATPSDLAAALTARLGALARSHDLTRAEVSGGGDEATTMHALMRAILAPYGEFGEEGGRVAIEGPDAAVGNGAVTSFALLLHELATNAAKYGALSAPAGRVEIRCAEDAGRYRMTWTETGGPAVTPATEGDGFGTALARAAVEGQLGGAITRRWLPDGLVIELDVAADRLRPGGGVRE